LLINDPKLNSLSNTQFIYEVESLAFQEELEAEKYKKTAEIIKEALVNYLGLNMVPVEDSETGMLRMPKDNEVMPLAALIGNPEILAQVAKKHEELQQQNEIQDQLEMEELYGEEMSPEELEEFFDDGSDLEFIDNPEEFQKHLIWNSAETQAALNSMVTPLEDAEDPYELLEKESSDSYVNKKEKRITIDE
jgi:hypothetical protein